VAWRLSPVATDDPKLHLLNQIRNALAEPGGTRPPARLTSLSCVSEPGQNCAERRMNPPPDPQIARAALPSLAQRCDWR
jgi:hypothetical protein